MERVREDALPAEDLLLDEQEGVERARAEDEQREQPIELSPCLTTTIGLVKRPHAHEGVRERRAGHRPVRTALELVEKVEAGRSAEHGDVRVERPDDASDLRRARLGLDLEGDDLLDLVSEPQE